MLPGARPQARPQATTIIIKKLIIMLLLIYRPQPGAQGQGLGAGRIVPLFLHNVILGPCAIIIIIKIIMMDKNR